MTSFPATWKSDTIGNVLEPISASTSKVQRRDYKPVGRIPVVDQGQGLIAGWTDEADAEIRDPIPLVVFGDHTRALKYVDFAFARGADGTQLLRPHDEIDVRYFYFACLSVDLPARGYNRHFSIFREKAIAWPGWNEQCQIASVLALAEGLARRQDEVIEQLVSVKRAAMRELFTRGLRGSVQKQTELGPVPENWRLVPLGSIGKIGSGTTPDRTRAEYWSGGHVPWITSGRMYEREIRGAEEYVTRVAIDNSNLPILKPGAVLLAIVGQGKTLGHSAILRVEATISRHVGYVQPDQDIVAPEYLRDYLESQYEYLRQLASGNGSTRAALTAGILRAIQIPVPLKLEEQREISSILGAIDRKIDLHKRKKAVLEDLFKALLHKLMTGEIRVADLDLSVLDRAPVAREIAA